MIRKKHFVNMLVIFWIIVGLIPQVIHQPTRATSLESLLLNEIMYHPSDNENTNEWIELYNPTLESIDVADWMIADEKETDTIQADIDHGNGTTFIPPKGYALLTDRGTTVYDTMDVPIDTVRLVVDDSTLCGYGLNNNYEKIILFNAEGDCQDAIEWGQDYEEVPGAPFAGVSKGTTLARYHETDTNDTFHDFFENINPTPGSDNQQSIPDEPPEEEPPSEEQPPDENIETNTPSIFITELFYDAHPNINAEYVRLCNPTNNTIMISGWYLTDKPWKEPDDRPKIFFPDGTFMPPHTSWVVTKNASAFLWETALLPDYEYAVDSDPTVPQLDLFRTIIFSNIGGLVGLYTASHNLVDLIKYGTIDECSSGWEGSSVPSSGQGVILKRNYITGMPVDTDTASDWVHPRIYQIGQSEFSVHSINFTGEVTVFVSPDSSFKAIIDEIRNAKQSIEINMYEFTNLFLYQELCDALQRNITVRLFMEGSPVGGIDNREIFILHSLTSKGAQVRLLVSDPEKDINARYQFNHAKYLLIDNDTVIVESCNWANTGIPKSPTYGNREWGIILRNKEVAAMFWQVYQDDWNPLHSDSRSLEALNITFYPDVALDAAAPTGTYTSRFNATTFIEPCRVTPVFSPDTSEQVLLDAIDAATHTIDIQQLYIYKDWGETISPLLEHLVNRSTEGVRVRVILDYNGNHETTTTMLEETKEYLETYGVEVKFMNSDCSPFVTIHNKGMIVDNMTVLISSINWNEQSIRKNREAGVLVQNQKVASYYTSVFLSDWYNTPQIINTEVSSTDYKYLVLIAVVVCITLVLIARDWRKRKWS